MSAAKVKFMVEDTEVKRIWRNYQVTWVFNIVVSAIALGFLTIVPVANPEWPMVLGVFWAIGLIGIYCAVSDYLETRRGYLRFRLTEVTLHREIK